MQNTTANICSKRVVVDYRLQQEARYQLKNLGYTIVDTVKLPVLYNAIDGHADIQLCKIDNYIIVAPQTYEYYCNILSDANVIKGSKSLNGTYPYDIPYNCAVLKDYIICNEPYTENTIKNIALTANRKILNVPQGYSKCSICLVSGEAIITADKSIYDVCKKNKIDVLKISEGHIELDGMNYGFIGGVGGLINETTLALNGELKTHPDCNDIKAFCKNHNVDIVELKKGPLYDIGSIILV